METSRLCDNVFADGAESTIAPTAEDVDGFNAFIEEYKKLLEVEKKAIEALR